MRPTFLLMLASETVFARVLHHFVSTEAFHRSLALEAMRKSALTDVTGGQPHPSPSDVNAEICNHGIPGWAQLCMARSMPLTT